MNIHRMLTIVLGLKWFIIISVVVGLGTGFAFHLKMKRMSSLFEYKTIGLFHEMHNRELVWYAVGIVRIIFMTSIACFYTTLQTKELVGYVLLCVAYNVLHFQYRRLFFEALNSVVLYLFLMFATFLKSYLLDTAVEIKIVWVYGLLVLFLLLDSVILFLKDIIYLLRRKAT